MYRSDSTTCRCTAAFRNAEAAQLKLDRTVRLLIGRGQGRMVECYFPTLFRSADRIFPAFGKMDRKSGSLDRKTICPLDRWTVDHMPFGPVDRIFFGPLDRLSYGPRTVCSLDRGPYVLWTGGPYVPAVVYPMWRLAG